MKKNQILSAWLLSMFVSLGLAFPAFAEFSCAPDNATITFPEKDPFFAATIVAWSKTTRGRYTEGTTPDACTDVKVSGYEGFPTKRCKYESADAGKGIFPALPAEVIVLNPSAKQLAAWSIAACRTNGAKDAAMPDCLERLLSHVVRSNGAQYPVAGSVVESYCNSSSSYGTCESLLKSKGDGLRPRHTWFRDGVSIYFQSLLDVRWDDRDYSGKYGLLFDVDKADEHIDSTRYVARLAAAQREQWRSWRKHMKKPEMVEGSIGSVDGHGWRTVAAYVHKAACKGASNELFDAVVFANKAWIKQ
jgi:hypothetical protein